MTSTPRRPFLCFYADDLTGATDVMDAVARAGRRAVVLLDPARTAAFEGVDAIGIAGDTRSRPADEIEPLLQPVLRDLRALGSPVVLYKVCSTFDSSPTIGSIGRALETGLSVFERQVAVPIVIAAPRLGRYVAFGNLFARATHGETPYRLDRHPTMHRHPITPMDESELRLHLGRQTKLSLGLVDLTLIGAIESAYRRALSEGARAVFFDSVDEEHVRLVGEELWRLAREGESLFVIGSSGVVDALMANSTDSADSLEYRQELGHAPTLVVSGSSSPVSVTQIRCAVAHGFIELPLIEPDAPRSSAEFEAVATAAANALDAGRSVVIHASVDSTRRYDPRAVAATLADLAKRVVHGTGARRVVVAGGDTSGVVLRRLGVNAIEALRESAAGAPLCTAYSDDPRIDGLELVLKGGQLGGEEMLVDVAAGRPSRG